MANSAFGGIAGQSPRHQANAGCGVGNGRGGMREEERLDRACEPDGVTAVAIGMTWPIGDSAGLPRARLHWDLLRITGQDRAGKVVR